MNIYDEAPLNMSAEQLTDWREHVERLWENIFLRAGFENPLEWESEVDGWEVYGSGGKTPYLSMQAGPANVSFKADPMQVVAAFRTFVDELEKAVTDHSNAGAFLPRVVQTAEALDLMSKNRKLRRAK